MCTPTKLPELFGSMGSFTRNSRISSGAVTLPKIPVKITAATAMETMPPWLSATAAAMGVVTDLGSSDTIISRFRPNSLHSSRTLPMIVILKKNPNRDQLESLISWLQDKGIIIHTSIGESNTILGLVGDTSRLDIDLIAALDIVEDVKRVQEPYKNANRKFHPEDTVVQVGNTQVGGGTLTLMAGPCSVETEDQVVAIAKAVKASGATMDSPQGDKAVLKVLHAFGAEVSVFGDAATVSPGPLRGITLDVAEIPDLLPVLAVVAACAQGETRFEGAARLRLKESDRLSSTAAMRGRWWTPFSPPTAGWTALSSTPAPTPTPAWRCWTR